MNLKLTNIKPEDYILAVRAAKSMINQYGANMPIGIRHGSCLGYGPLNCPNDQLKYFYVYRVKTGIVVRYSGG